MFVCYIYIVILNICEPYISFGILQRSLIFLVKFNLIELFIKKLCAAEQFT